MILLEQWRRHEETYPSLPSDYVVDAVSFEEGKRSDGNIESMPIFSCVGYLVEKVDASNLGSTKCLGNAPR